jgi:magnesium-transporting ATPase (P-type)
MITGDKQETAENIGKSCKLLKEDTHIIRVVGSKTKEACMTQLAECEEQLKVRID